MTTTTVVGVDGRTGGRDAIALARALTPPDGRIVLAGIWQVGHLLVTSPYAQEAAAAARLTLAAERERAGIEAEVVAFGDASVARGLHHLAEREGADLIVVGASRRGTVGRLLLGDDARATLHASPCAVAVAPSGWSRRPAAIVRVAVGYDGSPEAAAALARARVVAERAKAVVEVVHAVEPVSEFVAGAPFAYAEIPAHVLEELEREAMAEAEQRVEALEGVDGRAEAGRAIDVLGRASGHADLLVVGSRGHGPFQRLTLGSTATGLLGRALSPLLVVPRPTSDEHAETQAAGAAGAAGR
jgi:nucleotide-binding universal stress UspA family protein